MSPSPFCSSVKGMSLHCLSKYYLHILATTKSIKFHTGYSNNLDTAMSFISILVALLDLQMRLSVMVAFK